jgi:hypothetical protein
MGSSILVVEFFTLPPPSLCGYFPPRHPRAGFPLPFVQFNTFRSFSFPPARAVRPHRQLLRATDDPGGISPTARTRPCGHVVYLFGTRKGGALTGAHLIYRVHDAFLAVFDISAHVRGDILCPTFEWSKRKDSVRHRGIRPRGRRASRRLTQTTVRHNNH